MCNMCRGRAWAAREPTEVDATRSAFGRLGQLPSRRRPRLDGRRAAGTERRRAAVLERPGVSVVCEVEEIGAVGGARDDGVARGGGHHLRRLGRAHERAVGGVGDDVDDVCLRDEIGVCHRAVVLPLRHVHVDAPVRAVAHGRAAPRPRGLRRSVRVARVLCGARRGQQVQRLAVPPLPCRVARALRAGIAHARQLAIIVGAARPPTLRQRSQPRARLREGRQQRGATCPGNQHAALAWTAANKPYRLVSCKL